MIANGIGFPNEIIDALENGRLVVFAGAGVSYDSPTSLPGFQELTNRIVSETGLQFDPKRTDYETILGDTEAKLGYDVNKKAAELLGDKCREPNRTHEAIVNLFRGADSVRIVTTNYDLMFEKALEKQEWSVNRYSAPALPMGNDFSGIVHVHGVVNDSKYMVLTDEDFGAAYITEGYSSRFLTSLFMNYTVLFIGYSYNDTIVKYLTRAIAQKKSGRLFVLIDDQKTEWELMGIEPIIYDSGDHPKMQEALVEIGRFIKRPLADWKSKFELLSEEPPTDPTSDSEISFCLSDTSKARLLASCVHGPKWTEYFVKKGVFANWFDSNYKPSQIDEIWENWIVDKSDQQYDAVTDVMGWYGGRQINPTIVNEILNRLSRANLSNHSFVTIINVLGIKYLTSYHSVRFIMALCRRELFKEAFDIFLEMFEPIFFVKNEKAEHKENVVSWKYCWSKQEADYAWEELCKGEYDRHPETFLRRIISRFSDIYNRCSQILLNNDEAKLYLSSIDIEDEKDWHWDDPIILLAHVFIFFAIRTQAKDSVVLTRMIEECVDHPFIILRRAALIALRESRIISLQDKYKVLLKGVSWDYFSGRKQVFLLGQEIISQLNEEQQNELIDAIKKANDYSGGDNIPVNVFKWAEWLHRTENNNVEINRLVKLGEKKKYTPQKHPEDLVDIECEQVFSPLNKNKMKQMNISELIRYITEYKPESVSDFSAVELHQELIRCVSEADSEWILELVREYFKTQLNDKTFVQSILTGIGNSRINGDFLWDIVNLLADNSERVDDYTEIASLLLKAVQDTNTMNLPKRHEKDFWHIAKHIRKATKGTIKHDNTSLWNEVCNNPVGLIAISAVWMLSYREGNEGVDCFIPFFNRMLADSINRKLVVSVLSGQIDMFWISARDWCADNIISWLRGNCKEDFQAAWIGVDRAGVYWGTKVGKDIVNVFVSALNKLSDWPDEETSNAIAVRVAQSLMLTPDLYEEINSKIIPQLYRSIGEKGREKFVGRLGGLLKKIKPAQKKVLWEDWIGKYYKNRFDNLPIKASQRELEELLDWLIVLEDTYDEAARIVVRSTIEIESSFSFWYKWAKSSVIKEYPSVSVELLERLLPRFANKELIIQHVNEIKDKIWANLNANEQHNLNEIMIRNGCYITSE